MAQSEVIAQTLAGAVRGVVAGGIAGFKGIPYAATTGGPARWQPASPAVPWPGVRDATAWAVWAPQWQRPVAFRSDAWRAILPGYGDPLAVGEDCLTVNVWTPTLDGTRPVLVWLHGGGFETGGPSYGDRSDGARLARRGDVVVVSVTHRLGVLGFLSLDGLGREEHTASGNLGMLDIVAALEWVRAAIGAFGGDPENVTVFGESGGGQKVQTLLALPAARGLFHRAICQSGPPTRGHSPEQAQRRTAAVAAELGLERPTLDDLLAVPVDDLIAADLRIASVPGGGVPSYQPVVDGAVLPASPLQAIAAGDGADVPLMIGTNLDEWRFYLSADPRVATLEDAGLRQRLQPALGESTDRIVDAYRAELPQATAADLLVMIDSDRLFRIPAIEIAETRVATAPTFMYLFAWRSEAIPEAGAAHGLETPFVFDTLGAVGVSTPTKDGAALAAATSAAWAAFAHTGAPGHAGLPDWPAYAPGQRATMVLDDECKLALDPYAGVREIWKGVRLGM